MDIKGNVDWDAVKEAQEKFMEEYRAQAIAWLSYLGELCYIKAKTTRGYMDRTGNLVNSVGYVVVDYGKIVESKFEVELRGKDFIADGVKGEDIGKAYAETLAEAHKSGFALIVVAGMEYASYVEDIHHRDVLNPAKAYAEAEIDNIVLNILNSLK